jgi:hypothetical protein
MVASASVVGALFCDPLDSRLLSRLRRPEWLSASMPAGFRPVEIEHEVPHEQPGMEF